LPSPSSCLRKNPQTDPTPFHTFTPSINPTFNSPAQAALPSGAE
jgi:hypothetical protein